MNEPFASVARRLAVAAPRLLGSFTVHRGDVADLFAEDSHVEHVSLEGAGQPTYRERRRRVRGSAVRVVTGTETRFRHTESLEPAGIRALGAELSREAEGVPARRSGPDPRRAPTGARRKHVARTADIPQSAERGSMTGTSHGTADRETSRAGSIADFPDDASQAEKRALLLSAVDAALSLDPTLDRVVAGLQGHVRRTFVATSDGACADSVSSLVGLRVAVEVARDGRRTYSYAVGGGTGGLGLFLAQPPEEIARECVERLQTMLQAHAFRMPSGIMPVVLAAGWGGVLLHEAVGHLLEADNARHGPFGPSKIGSSVAAAGVTIVDDPCRAGGRGSHEVDDEGTASTRTVLVEDGVLRGLMTDRVTARALGLPRSGNGRRQDFRHEPLPRMTNFFLENGTAAPGDLLEDVRAGLFVGMVGNGRLDLSRDEFSFDVLEGRLIENGRPSGPVTGIRLHGRPSTLLRQIVGIADDLRFDAGRGVCVKAGQRVPVSAGMPTILVDGLRVEPVESG